MSYVIIQMRVWDILPSPWAEATGNLLILDTFHSQLSILTACFTVDGLISVGKHHHPQQLLAVGDQPHRKHRSKQAPQPLHDQRSSKGLMALAPSLSQLVRRGRSW